MKKIKQLVRECNLNNEMCSLCRNPINHSEIIIRTKWVDRKVTSYHLHCYRPSISRLLFLKDFKIELKNENTKVFEDWLEKWNSTLIKTEASIFHPIVAKSILSFSTKNKRILIEVFKFLTIKDIISSITYVNKEFYHATWESELWKSLMIRDFNINTNENSCKASYINEYNRRCYECKRVPKDDDADYCPCLKRIICNSCRKLTKYRKISKAKIFNRFCISPSTIGLKLHKELNGQKETYEFLAIAAIEKFRAKNKEFALNKLRERFSENSYFIRAVKKINTKEMEILDWIGKYVQKYKATEGTHNNFFKIANWIRSDGSERKLLKIIMKMQKT